MADPKSNDYTNSIIKCIVSKIDSIDQISVSCDHLSTVASNHIYLNSLDGNLISM